MPSLNRAPNEKELEYLIRLFLKAETSIINEIGRLRSQGLVDYHAVAALERVQKILRELESDCWEYVPKMIEKQFYVRVPEALFLLRTANKYGIIAVKRLLYRIKFVPASSSLRSDGRWTHYTNALRAYGIIISIKWNTAITGSGPAFSLDPFHTGETVWRYQNYDSTP